MTEAELRAEIKAGTGPGGVCGGYLLYGEEEYLKRFYKNEIRRAALSNCPPGLTEFNHILLSPEEGDFSSLQQALMQMPMMSDRLLIEVTPSVSGAWKEKDRRALLEALSALDHTPDTVLVLVAAAGAIDPGTPRRPSAFFRQLTEHLKAVEFPLQTGVRLRRWVERHFAEEHLTIPDDVITALLARCAPDMTTLASEIGKLCAYETARHSDSVSMEDMLLVTSPGMRETAFALANAVLAGDRTAALAALDLHRKRREEPIMLLASLSRILSDLLTVAAMMQEKYEKPEIAKMLKMHEFKAAMYMRAAADFGYDRVEAALRECIDADRLSKSAQMGYIPLERFICTTTLCAGIAGDTADAADIAGTGIPAAVTTGTTAANG